MNYIEMAQQHIEELYPIISYQNPTVAMLPAGAILGTWQYSIPGKMRFILNRDAELATGVLPSDVARAWIRDQYKLPIRRRKSQLVRGFPAPVLAKRGHFGDCAYIDIKGAYLRILAMGYDVEYIRGRYIGARPNKIPQEIIDHKFCYSMSVSMSASPLSNITIMGHEGTFQHKPMNLFSNPCLFNLAQDTLNGIAADVMDKLGDRVHYINTDGYIVDADAQWECIDIVNQWGFDVQLKAFGETEIRGVASYICGARRTTRFDIRAQDFQSKFMDTSDVQWLRDKWQRWMPKLTSFYKSEQNHNKFIPSGLQPTYYAL